jgi:hypothetical protein
MRSSSRQPEPTVPEPITSPGRRRVDREAWAMIAPQPWWIEASSPRLRSCPLTRATMVADGTPSTSSSSGVTRTGPSEVAKSLPLAGPSPWRISRRCRSRADQSSMIVNPATTSSQRPGSTSAHSTPITAATSSS